MKPLLQASLLTVALCLAATPPAALAQSDGVTLHFLQKDSDTPDGRPVRFQVRDKKVRVDQGDEGGAAFTLYDAGAGDMFIVDPANRGYARLDRETIANLEQVLQRSIEQRLSQLPADQREHARAMLDRHRPRPDAEQPEGKLEVRDDKRSYAGHTCRMHRYYLNGRAEQDMCLATRESLQITEDNYAALVGMIRASQQMAAAARSLGGPAAMPVELIEHMPIFTRSLLDGSSEHFELLRLERDDPGAKAFEVPDDFSRQQLF